MNHVKLLLMILMVINIYFLILILNFFLIIIFIIIFIDIAFKISCQPDSPQVVKVNMAIKAAADLKRYFIF